LVISLTIPSVPSTEFVNVVGSYASQGCAGSSGSFGYTIVHVPSSGTAKVPGYTLVNSAAGVSSTGTFTRSYKANSGDQILFIMNDAGTTGVCDGAVIQLTFTSSAAATGDPRFSGFLGQRFVFSGHGNKVYSLYSDNQVAINSRFISQIHEGLVLNGTENYSGTYMGAYGIMLGNLASIEVSSDSYNREAKVLTVLIDQKATNLTSDSLNLGECSYLSWSAPELTIEYGPYVFVIEFSQARTDRVKSKHLNLNLIVASQSRHKRNGGLIGQTTVHKPLDRNEDHFIVHPSSNLFSLNSVTNQLYPSLSSHYVEGSCDDPQENSPAASVNHLATE